MGTLTIYMFRVRSYAAAIYLDGTQRLTARDGFTGVPADYVGPIETYAAATYTVSPYATTNDPLIKLNNALNNGWINQTEYDDTIALIPAN